MKRKFVQNYFIVAILQFRMTVVTVVPEFGTLLHQQSRLKRINGSVCLSWIKFNVFLYNLK